MCDTKNGFGIETVKTDSVLALAQQGDNAAFNLIALEYESIIAAKASLAHTKGVDFEDLLQEGYMALFNAVKTYSPEAGATFKTYAAVCIGNRIASVARNHGSSKNRALHDYSELADDEMAADSYYEPEFAVFARDRLNTIHQHMALLLSDTENSVLMHYLSGKSYAEISEELGMTEKSVDNALQRARRKLKTALENQQ